MDHEYRKQSRIGTHIVAEIGVEGQSHVSCGYIENLSKEGMGVLSLEMFDPGVKITPSFYLAGVSGKITPKATMIHSEKGIYNLYYYGFKFDALTEKEGRAIEQYMQENALTQTA